MERQTELLKFYANHFARIVGSEDCIEAIRLLRYMGLWGQPSDHDPQETPTERNGKAGRTSHCPTEPTNNERVGIWERYKNTDYFTRRLDMAQDWGFWANTGQIKPKGTKKRVLLIGESVARGYLYDPQFTPAKALETILQSQLGTGGVEVIDLARTNLGLEVKELVISALLLEPDVVVIFSGNNWRRSYSSTDIPYIVSILHERGVPGLKQFYEELLAEFVRGLVRGVDKAYRAKNVPLVWIIPEFNLGDWRDPLTNAPHLHNGSNQEWMAYWEGARAALEEGDVKAASDLAQKMVELDQKVCVSGLYILAECSQRQGDLDAARYYLECARDATMWNSSPSMNSPRPYSVIQKTLREEVSKHSHGIVDLPELLKDYLKGKLPDRNLFLDYCHLRSEGIWISMAAAASCVLRALKGTNIAWPALLKQSLTLSSKVEAEAAFLAAIHNAHWHQRYDLAHYYCLQALQLEPNIAQVMTRFIDIQCRRLPTLLCKSAEEIADLEWPSIHHYLFGHDNKRLDKLLLEAIVNSLSTVGIDHTGRLDQTRLEEHSVTLGKTNLLEYYYCSAAMQTQEALWVTPGLFAPTPSHYYKAYSPESKFFFVGEAFCPVSLSLTCRLPNSGPSKDIIFIAINGRDQKKLVVGCEWITWDIAVEGIDVQSGLNEIVVRWPIPTSPGKQGIEAASASILQGVPPEFYCIFGEIHSFSVSDAREPEITASVGQELFSEQSAVLQS